MATYADKLRDPRWQRRRLEILSKSDFCCCECGDNTKTLNVHHKIYRKGRDPWDYPDSELTALCVDCHTEQHEIRDSITETMAVLESCDIAVIDGFAHGLGLGTCLDSVKVKSFEHAHGIALAFHLSAQDVIEMVGVNGAIKSEQLFRAEMALRAPTQDQSDIKAISK